MFDVNAEKIHCSHCNKEIGRDDKFIFIHYLSFNSFIKHNTEPKCFCCTECAKLNEPTLETFINDMVVKHRNLYMYSPDSIFFHNNDVDIENEQPRMIALVQAFNLLVDKYHTSRLFIELNATLNKLKKRQEKQMKD